MYKSQLLGLKVSTIFIIYLCFLFANVTHTFLF